MLCFAACFLYCFLYYFLYCFFCIYIAIFIVNSNMTQVNEKEIYEQFDTLSNVIKKKSRPVTAILHNVSSVSSVYTSLHISEHSAIVTLSTEVNTPFDIFSLFLFMNLLCFISQYINQNADMQWPSVTNVSLNNSELKNKEPKSRK